MTCHETREHLSAWLDEALDTSERAQVDAHLAGCADCRRELEALRSTISLLARVGPARAPAGFVDKVMSGCHPTPWHLRLGRLIFLPLSVKLPVEAGAVIVIALLGVYLLQSTPELRDATRRDSPAPVFRPEPPAPVPSPAPPAPASPPLPEGAARLEKAMPPATRNQRESASVNRPAEQPPPMPEKRRETEQVAAPLALPSAPEQATAAAPLPRAAAPSGAGSREGGADRPGADKGALVAPPAASSVMSGKQQAVPLIVGTLTVRDKGEAERALADLISRSGAQEVGRRQDGTATVVDVAVPPAAYAAFTKDLAALGSLRIAGASVAASIPVRLSIRVSE
jgi:hypothetical protein